MSAPQAPFSPLIEHALELSAQWHDQTYRKGGWRPAPFESGNEEVLQVPVIAHVAAVGFSLARAGWDEATIAAGILHDALEDEDRHGRVLAERTLREVVGDAVVNLVIQVTEQKVDAHGHIRSWRARKEDYLEQLAGAPIEAWAISTADKLHNLWSINQALSASIDVFLPSANRRALTAGPEQQRWFHRSVLAITEGASDERLFGLRAQLRKEVLRFEELTAAPQK